jgi:UDP-glucose 4-epimerase
LLTGGAGCIGFHTAVTLLEAGCAVVVVDRLVNSNVQSVHTIERLTGQRVSFYQTDLREPTRLTQILRDEKLTMGS